MSVCENQSATSLNGVNGLKSVHSPATMLPSVRSMSVAPRAQNTNRRVLLFGRGRGDRDEHSRPAGRLVAPKFFVAALRFRIIVVGVTQCAIE